MFHTFVSSGSDTRGGKHGAKAARTWVVTGDGRGRKPGLFTNVFVCMFVRKCNVCACLLVFNMYLSF